MNEMEWKNWKNILKKELVVLAFISKIGSGFLYPYICCLITSGQLGLLSL